MKLRSSLSLNKILVSLLGLKIFLPSVLVIFALIIIGLFLTGQAAQQEQIKTSNAVAITVYDFIANARQELDGVVLVTDWENPETMSSYVAAAQQTSSYFDHIAVFDQRGKLFSAAPEDANLNNMELLAQDSLIQGTPTTIFRLTRPFLNEDQNSVSIYAIRYINGGGMVIGSIKLDGVMRLISGDTIQERGRIVYLIDENGYLLAHPNRDQVAQQLRENHPFGDGDQTERFINRTFLSKTIVNLSGTRWMVISEISYLNALSAYLVFSVVILLVFILLWGYLTIRVRGELSRKIVSPLSRLSKDSNIPGPGEPVLGISIERDTQPLQEIVDLKTNFERMINEIQSREAAIVENEQKYRALIEQSNDAICLEVDSHFEIINHTFSDLFGISRASINDTEVDFMHLVAPQSCAFVHAQRQRLQQRKVISSRYEFTAINRNGEEIDVEASSSVFPYQGGTAMQTILRDITERKRAEQAEHEQRVLAEALRDSAEALNSSLNFNELMVRVLSNVGKVVPHDSSNIMLIDEDDNTAHIVASQGYMSLGLQSYLDRVALSIRDTDTLNKMYRTGAPLIIPDTSNSSENMTWINIPETSWIRSYAAAPIKVKEKIIGFLNLNSPIPNFFTPKMADRLMAFADQAGIALNNASLVRDLQKTNQDLIDSYDITLQGWSKALELRDYETEGHSQRVVDMTLRLAAEMGIKEPELTHIRYGVLLHDIGKIGIPDRILFKPGPLNDEEWKIMRLHPEYALRILSPIPYLTNAVDIPYCHHERWDGMGYPQGLKGNKIPLAARIFSVVDVWDGLRSHRPYHSSWAIEDVYRYIEEQSGKHFDPEIVRAFLKLVREEERQVS